MKLWFKEAVLQNVMNKGTYILAENFTEKLLFYYFSSILFKSFRRLALQNTSLYICSK